MKAKGPGLAIEFAGLPLERLWGLVPAISKNSNFVPQANDLQKVFDLVSRLRLEIIDITSVAAAFQFDERQAFYYIEAARELGLLEGFASSAYKLTPEGERMRNSGEKVALLAFAKAVVALPIISRTLGALREKPNHSISRAEVTDIAVEIAAGRYTRSTLSRRVECIAAWARWLESNSEFVPPL